MIAASGPPGRLTDTQEHTWFRLCVFALVVFFVAGGGGSAWFQWRTKGVQHLHHRQLMDPAAPESRRHRSRRELTEGAVPVHVGMYVERISELSTSDATWAAVFDVWFRRRGDELNPADGFVVMDALHRGGHRVASDVHQADRCGPTIRPGRRRLACCGGQRLPREQLRAQHRRGRPGGHGQRSRHLHHPRHADRIDGVVYLYDRCGEVALSRRLDRTSFAIMATGFIGVNLLLVLAAAS